MEYNLMPEVEPRQKQYIIKSPKNIRDGAATFFIPGILGDGRNFETLAEDIGEDNNLYRVNYAGDDFEPDELSDNLTDECEQLLDQHGALTLIGSSMGGYMMVDIVTKLRARGRKEVISGVGVDVLDGPSSIKAREAIGLYAFKLLKINRLLGNIPILDSIVTQIAKTVAVKPSQQDAEKGIEWSEVHAATVHNLKTGDGSGRRIAGMVPYMFTKAKISLNDLQDETGKNLFNQLDYISCRGHNVTVKQPQAQYSWGHAGATIHEIDAAHCSYSWQPEIWKTIFKLVLTTKNPIEHLTLDNTDLAA